MVPRKKSLCSLLLTTMLLVILSLSPEFTVLTHSISTNITNIIFKSSDNTFCIHFSLLRQLVCLLISTNCLVGLRLEKNLHVAKSKYGFDFVWMKYNERGTQGSAR